MLRTVPTSPALSSSSITAASFVWAGETPLAPARLLLTAPASPPRTPWSAPPPPAHVKHKLLVFTFKAFPSCSRQLGEARSSLHAARGCSNTRVSALGASIHPNTHISALGTNSHPNTCVSNLVSHQPFHHFCISPGSWYPRE